MSEFNPFTSVEQKKQKQIISKAFNVRKKLIEETDAVKDQKDDEEEDDESEDEK